MGKKEEFNDVELVITPGAGAGLGRAIPISDAVDKVRGKIKYVDDLPAELTIKVLGSPHAHAHIRAIDTTRSEQLEGVKAVMTYKDVAHKEVNFGAHRRSFIMDQHLRHVGDYVAAVAATSAAIAEQALSLIDVDYEVLPAVFDAEEALNPDAPKLYPQGNDWQDSFEHFPPGVAACKHAIQDWGDLDRGWQSADLVVEDCYTVTPQVHSAIEPHVCMARWNGDQLIIHAACQTPWELRLITADYFEIPISKVSVHTENVGGGFGGKYTGRYQFIACQLSRMAGGKSARLTLTREESQVAIRRPSGKLYAKVGAKRNGRITALEFRGYFDIGAYGSFHGGSNGFHCEGGILSYNVPNARFEAWDVHTNHFRSDCFRSVQMPYVSFGLESIVDKLAIELGLDPVTIRQLNMPKTNDRMPPTDYVNNGEHFPNGRLDLFPGKELMQKVLDKFGWQEKFKGYGMPTAVNGSKRRGVGLAYCQGYSGYYCDGATNIQVVLHADGSATIHSGAQEIGQGVNTGLRQLAAESLGLDVESVSVFSGDTRSEAFDLVNSRSSHQLTTNGSLLLKACEDIKRQVRERAAPLLEVGADELELVDRRIQLKGDPARSIPLRDLFGVVTVHQYGHVEGLWASCNAPFKANASGAPGSINPSAKPREAEHYKSHQPMVVALELEVDTETGEITPLNLVSGSFPGRVVNHGLARGQLLGGAAQALGMALWEELRYDEQGAVLSNNFADYRLPRVKDMPEVDTILYEQVDDTRPHEGLPFGGRAIGEMSAWFAVVVSNALYNALGVKVKHSPMTPETVLTAIAKEDAR